MKTIAMALAALAVCTPASAAYDELKVGDRLRNEVEIGKGGVERRIPLPAGDWEIVRVDYKAKGVRYTQASQISAPLMTVLILAQRSGPDIAMLMRIMALREDTYVQRWMDDPCQNTRTLYRNVYDSGVWDTKCLLVNHVPGFIAKSGPGFADVREWTVKEGVHYPATALSSTLTKFGANQYATVTFWANPALRKLDSDEPSWAASPFNRDRIASDPERKKYVDEFVAWSEAYMKALVPFGGAAPVRDFPAFR